MCQGFATGQRTPPHALSGSPAIISVCVPYMYLAALQEGSFILHIGLHLVSRLHYIFYIYFLTLIRYYLIFIEV